MAQVYPLPDRMTLAALAENRPPTPVWAIAALFAVSSGLQWIVASLRIALPSFGVVSISYGGQQR
jgi:hypothetical protein